MQKKKKKKKKTTKKKKKKKSRSYNQIIGIFGGERLANDL